MDDVAKIAALVLGTKSLSRLVGPAADEVAEAFRRVTSYRLRNVGRIKDNAEAKLGKDLDSPGSVPSRLGFQLLNEGSYSDDEIVVEYLGGVLASSSESRGTTSTMGP